LRAAGRIPAVIYGHGDNPVSISIDARQLRTAFSSASGENALFDLDVAGERHLAIARELQRHPVRQTVSHVDFQVVSRDEVVPAEVPLHLTGEALGVTRPGGNVEQALFTLHVRAKPGEIPTAIEIDISALELGQTIRVAELSIPAGVLVELDPETPVVVAIAPRGLGTGEEGAEGAESAAAAEAPAAEGN
jgi:large subunit ribosomal protein L25